MDRAGIKQSGRSQIIDTSGSNVGKMRRSNNYDMKLNGPVNDIPLDIVGGSVNNFDSNKESNNPMMQTHDSDVSGRSFKSVFNNPGKISSRLSGKSGWAGPGHTQGTLPQFNDEQSHHSMISSGTGRR